MCSITMAPECNARPPLGALNFITRPEGLEAQGAAVLYQPVQTHLTSRPTTLSADCICCEGGLLLEGQMLIFLMWHIHEASDRYHWEERQLCCMFRVRVNCLPVFYTNLHSGEQFKNTSNLHQLTCQQSVCTPKELSIMIPETQTQTIYQV